MHRRTVLSRLTVALPLALAGCTGAPTADPGETDTTDEPSETGAPGSDTVTPGRISASLVPREECQNPGEATVSFGDETISVVGCVVGKNGCTVPRLQEVDYDQETGELTAVVASVEEREEDEACTEALVNLGYEVGIETEGIEPVSVRVVHDDVDGRRTVADVTK